MMITLRRGMTVTEDGGGSEGCDECVVDKYENTIKYSLIRAHHHD